MRRRAWMAALAVAVAAPASAQSMGVDVASEWAFASDAAHAGRSVRAALRFEIPGKFHVNSHQPLDEFMIPTSLVVEPPRGITVRQIVYPEPMLIDVQFSDERVSVFEQEFVIGVALDLDAEVRPGAYTIRGTLIYQACNDVICLAPDELRLTHTLEVVDQSTPINETGTPLLDGIAFSGDPSTAVAAPRSPRTPTAVTSAQDCDVMAEIADFTLLGAAGGYLDGEAFIAFIDGAESGTASKNLLEGKGPLAIVLLVLLGGIALNLTPCVLPLIPINLGIIGAGAHASSRARGFMLGGVYGLAMAVTYGVLGLIVVLTAGTFGSINSTIWFNLGIAILFVVLALAMFDLILIDFSKYQGKIDVSESKRRGTVALAFGMGVVTALLAGACVAPVVIQVIVYASDQYARGIAMALGLPFFLGLGMALPWPFAGAGLSCLPRPGKWMSWVKYAFGLFILVFAAYYLFLAWEIYDSRRVDRDLVSAAAHARLEEGWTGSICDGLVTARAEDRLVLVDMWATWCKNCFAMDKTTFRDPQVVARLEDYVKVKFQAEDLKASPARELIEHFEGIGLPTYAVLRPPSRQAPRTETRRP